MIEPLEKDIQALCPLIFRNKKSTVGLFGIQTGDGWHLLLRDALTAIEAIAKEMQRQGNKNLPVLSQVKDKNGALRIYVDNTNEEIESIISIAVERARSVCEFCGDPGVPHTGIYRAVTCDKHMPPEDEWE